jgi:succinate dehydrogenase/fumarate reductase-like Fe-S protein
LSGPAQRVARLWIWRGKEREAGHLEEYEVPYQEGASVLDALVWIRTHVDPSLAVRYSCTNANVCKECTVLIDGRVAFACTTRVGAEPIAVAPLPGKRIIRDLVTDIVPPLEHLTNLSKDK